MPTPRRWVYNPHSGGKAIPEAVRRRIKDRLHRYADRHFVGRYRELDVRFRGHFCYIDLYLNHDSEPGGWPPPGWGERREEFLERLRATPLHLVRLRYLGDDDGWSFAFYSYASDRYEPSIFSSGDVLGPPEDAFDLAAGIHLG